MLNGAHDDQAFTPEPLPATRREQFRDVLKNRWRLLCALSLVLLVSALPLMGGMLLLRQLKSADVPALAAGGTQAAGVVLRCFGWDLIAFAAGLAGTAVLAAGAGGALYILQLLAWGEGVIFSLDFPAGIRSSYRGMLRGGCLGCLAALSVTLNRDLLLWSEEAASLLAVSTVLTTAAALVLGVSAVFVAAQTLNYEVSPGDSIRNALILTVAYAPRNLLLALALGGPAALMCFGGLAARLICLAVMGLFGFAALGLGVLLYCGHIFDLSINPRTEGARLRRGLYTPPEDGS